jgi:endonuclease YncB( thermonuclease family)
MRLVSSRSFAPVAAALAVATAHPATARERTGPPPAPVSTVDLDGRPTRVRWIDGDTFRILDGDREDRTARLAGYNTLETYGPVHRWGRWRPDELLAVARAATDFAASRRWSCTSSRRQDRYRRVLVTCPDAAAELVRRGLAMAFALGRRPDPELLRLQARAQQERAGMWARGVPPVIVTSAHSASEPGAGEPYDRLVDTRTGLARARRHGSRYAACEEVCAGPENDRACLIYVPFERRHRQRPACLAAGSEATRDGQAARNHPE